VTIVIKSWPPTSARERAADRVQRSGDNLVGCPDERTLSMWDVIRLSGVGVGVYAHPAGYPLCGGWRHPTREALTTLVADRFERGDLCPNV
jgi:hypothetical protein